MTTKTHFQFCIDIWDDDGKNAVEHIAGLDGFQLTEVSYRAAIARWPEARIMLRQGAHVIHDTGRRQ